MNIEKTLQLIAESQARAERRADRAGQRIDRAEQESRDQHAKAIARIDRESQKAEEQHAKAMARLDEQHAKAMARYDKADQRMDRLEKKLNVTADLVQAGIKMVREMRLDDRKFQAETRERHKEFDYKFNALMGSHAHGSGGAENE